MAIYEVDADTIKKLAHKNKETKPKSAPRKRKDQDPESTPVKKVRVKKDPVEKVTKEEPAEKPAKKELTEKQLAAIELRRLKKEERDAAKKLAQENALAEKEAAIAAKAEKKAIAAEKRKAAAAEKRKAAPAEKRSSEEEDHPPKWFKKYISEAKKGDPAPEKVEEIARDVWSDPENRTKLQRKVKNHTTSMYNMIFRR
jgi:hypothetical protein